MKKCPKCLLTKEDCCYGKRNKGKYLDTYCKKCKSIKNREYRKNNINYFRDWEQKNKEKRTIQKRESGRKYRKTDKGRYNHYKNTSAKPRDLDFELTLPQFKLLTENKKCYLCGKKMENCGLDRLNSDLSYKVFSVLPCCFRCNKSKDNIKLKDYYEMCKKTYNNLKKYFE